MIEQFMEIRLPLGGFWSFVQLTQQSRILCSMGLGARQGPLGNPLGIHESPRN
jgi:hypothetical protein